MTTTSTTSLIQRQCKAAQRLCAFAVVMLVAFTPLTPWPVSISPARADGPGACFSTLIDYANVGLTGAEIAADPEFLACTSQVASGDVLADASVVLMAAFAATGAFNSRATCKAALNATIAKPILLALKALLESGGIISDALRAVLGDNAANQLIGFADNAAASDFADFIDTILAPLLQEVDCGCEIVGGGIEIGAAVVQTAKDGAACFAFLGDVAEAIGKGVVAAVQWLDNTINAIAGGVENVAEGAYCATIGAILGGCDDNKPPPEHLGTSAVPFTLACTAGYQFTYLVNANVPGGPRKPDCGCAPGAEMFQEYADSKTAFCSCHDHTMGYADNGCQPCSGVGMVVGMDGTCRAFNCQPMAGMQAAYGPNDTCVYTHACPDGAALDTTTGQCSYCPSNTYAVYGTISTFYNGAGANYEPNAAGRCYSCPGGTASLEGSLTCQPISCAANEKPDSANGAHSCVTCTNVMTFPIGTHGAHFDVCNDPDKPFKIPPCDWGESRQDGVCQPIVCADDEKVDLKTGSSCVMCDKIVVLQERVMVDGHPGFRPHGVCADQTGTLKAATPIAFGTVQLNVVPFGTLGTVPGFAGDGFAGGLPGVTPQPLPTGPASVVPLSALGAHGVTRPAGGYSVVPRGDPGPAGGQGVSLPAKSEAVTHEAPSRPRRPRPPSGRGKGQTIGARPTAGPTRTRKPANTGAVGVTLPAHGGNDSSSDNRPAADRGLSARPTPSLAKPSAAIPQLRPTAPVLQAAPERRLPLLSLPPMTPPHFKP